MGPAECPHSLLPPLFAKANRGIVACLKMDDRKVVYSDGPLIRVFSLRSAKNLGAVSGQQAAVVASLDYNQKVLVSGSTDHCVRVFDWDTHSLLRTSARRDRHQATVTGVRLTNYYPCKLVTASLDCDAKIWDLQDGQLVRSLNDRDAHRTGPLHALEVSQDLAVTGGGHYQGSGHLCLWDVRVGSLVGRIHAADHAITALHLHADSHACASGDAAGGVNLWDLRRLSATKPVEGGAPSPLLRISSCPDSPLETSAIYSLRVTPARLLTCQAQFLSTFHHFPQHSRPLHPLSPPAAPTPAPQSSRSYHRVGRLSVQYFQRHKPSTPNGHGRGGRRGGSASQDRQSHHNIFHCLDTSPELDVVAVGNCLCITSHTLPCPPPPSLSLCVFM